MLKEKIRESEGSLSQKQCKWLNHLFDKSGKLHLGKILWDSQEEAENAVQEIKDTSAKYNGVSEWEGFIPPVLSIDYSWHMQMPVLTE